MLFFQSMDLCLDRHPYVRLNFIYRLSLFVIVCMLLTVSHLYTLTGNYNTNELYCVSSLYNEWVCILSDGPALQGWHCHQTIQMSLQKPLHTALFWSAGISLRLQGKLGLPYNAVAAAVLSKRVSSFSANIKKSSIYLYVNSALCSFSRKCSSLAYCMNEQTI